MGNVDFDVIIVHGYRPEPNGEMAETLRLRLDKAIEIIRQTGFEGPVMLTGHGPHPNVAECALMAKYLIEKGVTNRLMLEPNSNDTIQFVAAMRKAFEFPHDLWLAKVYKMPPKFFVITSGTQVERMSLLFETLWDSENYEMSFAAAKNPPQKLHEELEHELASTRQALKVLSEKLEGRPGLADRFEKAAKVIEGTLKMDDADLQRFVDERVADVNRAAEVRNRKIEGRFMLRTERAEKNQDSMSTKAKVSLSRS